MKKTIITLTFVTTFIMASCVHPRQIGKLNMVSTRNVDLLLKYKLISNYSGGSNKELEKSRAVTLEDAIDQTVRKVPGGEFIMNAKVYLINHSFGKDKFYYAVEGDVWGVVTEVTYRGFKVGDKVTWKNKKNTIDKLKGTKKDYLTGVITGLKDNVKCLIKLDGTGDTIEIEYDGLTKTN